jgi:CD109 antigen
MLNFVPNIVILEYLKRANRLTPQIKSKALKNMEAGYQRELTYKRGDGSFSAFGNSDKSGSTWLTAFVLKSFLQARDHMDIDVRVINGMYKWLIARQLADGSFDEPGEVHHKAMQGGAGAKGSPALSAFVLTALLQDKQIAISNYSTQIQKAEQYLVSKLRESQSSYEVAIINYALHLYDSPAIDSAHQKLLNFATRSSDYTFWSASDSKKKDDLTDKQSFHFFLPKSNDVEATAYALMTNVLRKDIENSIPILRWLISQQNENGGFATTQDTVVGIQSLGAFATHVASNTIQLASVFRYGAGDEPIKSRRLEVIASNQMVLQRLDLTPNTRWVEIESSGFGTAIVQVSWQFNLAVSAEEPAFFLNPQLGKTSNENFLQLNICT